MEKSPRLSYRQIADGEYYSSRFSALVKRVSILIVWALQGLPLSPNFFTVLSTLFAVGATVALLAADSFAAFAACSLLTFVFDQVDGTWARTKKQSSAFGAFFDPFMDVVKFSAIDLGLLLIAYDDLLTRVGDVRLLLALIVGYCTLRELYTASSPAPKPPALGARPRSLGLTSAAARFCVVFPALALLPTLIPWYFAASLLMHAYKVVGFVLARHRASTSAKLNDE